MALTYERLHEVLTYTPFDGLFRWKIKLSRSIKIGDIGGSKRKDGYINISIDGTQYLAHRLAWMYVYGYFPENNIDHKFRIRNDNRIRKIREASQSCNIRNTGNRIDNTSGIKGVYWHKGREKWTAQIEVNGKNKGLGMYKDFDEAVCTRLAAEQCLDWSDCDISSPAFLYVQKMLGLNL